MLGEAEGAAGGLATGVLEGSVPEGLGSNELRRLAGRLVAELGALLRAEAGVVAR